LKNNITIKYTLIGFVFGLLFPIVAILIDCCLYNDDAFTLNSIVNRINTNPIHYIIFCAPLVLGFVFYFIGTVIEKLELSNSNLNRINIDLMDSNKTLDTFNYHISHDLKTVLNNSSALASMVKKYNDKGDKDKVNEIIEKLTRVTRNGTETVQSFLSLGRINTLHRTEKKVKTNIPKEVKKVLEINELEDLITISFNQMDFETLIVYSQLVESVFLNFITNTIKYNINKPSATIDLIKGSNCRIIKYKDNGIGVSEENMGKLFEPFVRLENNLNKEGNGVGLYLVKRLVNSIGGEVSASSKLGEGLEFTITLPTMKSNYIQSSASEMKIG